MIADIDPGYRDVQERTKNAHKQQKIARWQAEARRLHQAEQWAAVVEIGRQLHALDHAASDLDGLMTSARAEVAAEEQPKRLDVDYETHCACSTQATGDRPSQRWSALRR